MSNPASLSYSPNEVLYEEDNSKIPGGTSQSSGTSHVLASTSNSQENGVSSSSKTSDIERNSNENSVKPADTDQPKKDGNTKNPAASNAEDEKANSAEREIFQDNPTQPATDAANSGVSTPASSQVAPSAVPKNHGQYSSSQAQTCGLVFVQRVSRLPVVQCTAGVYRQAKASQALAGPLGLLELCAWACARPLQMAAAPLGDVCGAPLRAADWLLCRGLDATQAVFPCVNVHPAQMCGTTVTCVKDCVCFCPRTIVSTATTICSK